MWHPIDPGAIRITVLGTGTSQGIPVIGCDCAVCTSTDRHNKRLRAAVMITSRDKHLLIDSGPDFRQQMLTYGFTRLDAILLTHEHNDHISGLDDVRPVNFRQKTEIPMYGLPRVLDALRRRFDYVFDKTYSYPGLPKISLNTVFPGPAEIATIPLQVINVLHGDLPILGFRIGNFCYITDAKQIPPDQLVFFEGLDVLVVNALHHNEHFSHFNLSEALEFVRKVNPQQAYLTHLSHDMGLHAEVEAGLPEGVALAFDGLVVDLPSN